MLLNISKILPLLTLVKSKFHLNQDYCNPYTQILYLTVIARNRKKSLFVSFDYCLLEIEIGRVSLLFKLLQGKSKGQHSICT